MKIFRNNDKAFFVWLDHNKEGYVLNTRKGVDLNYMSLHISKCSHISTTTKRYAENAFTGREFIKICTIDPAEIVAWIASKGGSGVTRYCRTCKPNKKEIEALTKAGHHPGERKTNKHIGRKSPRATLTQTLVYERDPKVVEAVLGRSSGFCECCNEPAPFNKKRSGEPYLEVHHKTPLSEGGEDTVKNAEALCPNCHREKHFG